MFMCMRLASPLLHAFENLLLCYFLYNLSVPWALRRAIITEKVKLLLTLYKPLPPPFLDAIASLDLGYEREGGSKNH